MHALFYDGNKAICNLLFSSNGNKWVIESVSINITIKYQLFVEFTKAFKMQTE